MKHKLKKAWVWDSDINDFVEEKAEGYALNVCAGKSPVGDVKIDLDPQDKSVLKEDMRDLPFEDNEFDTVIWDPPWKIGYYQRMKPFFECVRVCRGGGKLIVNSYWIPTSKVVELKELYVRQDDEWSNVSVFSIFKKVEKNEKLDSFCPSNSAQEEASEDE